MITDVSHLRKLDVRGQIPVAPPAKLWQLTPTHALILSTETIPYTPSSDVTDVSSVYSAIFLTGPTSRQLLQKLTTLNVNDSAMPVGAARQTRLAHVNAMILREQEGFLLLNTRDVAAHVWEAMIHAGARS